MPNASEVKTQFLQCLKVRMDLFYTHPFVLDKLLDNNAQIVKYGALYDVKVISGVNLLDSIFSNVA